MFNCSLVVKCGFQEEQPLQEQDVNLARLADHDWLGGAARLTQVDLTHGLALNRGQKVSVALLYD